MKFAAFVRWIGKARRDGLAVMLPMTRNPLSTPTNLGTLGPSSGSLVGEAMAGNLVAATAQVGPPSARSSFAREAGHKDGPLASYCSVSISPSRVLDFLLSCCLSLAAASAGFGGRGGCTVLWPVCPVLPFGCPLAPLLFCPRLGDRPGRAGPCRLSNICCAGVNVLGLSQGTLAQ